MGFFMDFSLQSPLAGSDASIGAAAPANDHVYDHEDFIIRRPTMYKWL